MPVDTNHSLLQQICNCKYEYISNIQNTVLVLKKMIIKLCFMFGNLLVWCVWHDQEVV